MEEAGLDVQSLLSNLKTADGLFVTDEHQRIRHWSETAERILGVPASEAVGRHCYDVLVGKDFSGEPFCRSDCPVSRNAQKRRVVKDYDLVFEDKDGRRKRINNTILLWPAERGQEVVHLFRESRASVKPWARRVRPRSGAPAGNAGLTPLSRRELDVLRLVAAGLRTAEVAAALGVSVYTARNQLSSVMHKLDVRTRLEAALVASESGLV
jgi:PAS domain S-box-containing protein